MDFASINSSDRQLIAIMDFLKEPIIGLSLDFKITFLNSLAAQVFEQPTADLIGIDFQKFCKEHQISLNLFSQKQNVLNGKALKEHITYKKSKNMQCDFEIHVSPRLNDNTLSPCGFVLCFRALTAPQQTRKIQLQSLKNMTQKITGQIIEEQKSSEDYAKIMVDYYENIIAAMPGNIYWMNKDGIYLGCNDNNATYSGLASRKDIIGKTLYDLYDSDEAKLLDNINKEVMDSNQLKFLEEDTDPKEIYLTQKVPLHDPEGNVIGLLGVSFDITERKKMEEDLKKAKDAAEAANKVKSQFIANMQHDLRTPCAGLLGMMELYADQEQKPEKRENFYLLSEAARELLHILDNIVDINRLESGCFPILEKKFDIHALLERVIRIDEPMAMYKMLELRAIVDSEVPNILIGDEYRIHRILLNLLGNAVKFTEKGHVFIRVKVAQKKRKGKLILKLVIEDTGIGIPEKDQKDVFEKFVRLTASNRNQYKGSGLGLSIVKHFVHELEGEIDIESSPKKGTKFIVLLPLKTSILGDDAVLVEKDDRL